MKLSKTLIELVLDYLEKGEASSRKIAKELGIRKMQVAGVKAWRTMGKYGR